MPVARLDVTLPEGVWIRDVSEAFPDAVFRVLAALPDETMGVGLLEITAPDLGEVISAMEAREGVTSIELLRVVDDEALVQFETSDPLLLLSIRDSRVPFEPPVVISDGVAALEVTASRDRLSELGTQLERLGMAFEVLFVRQTLDASELLTEGQRSILFEAVERGYYDTPRGVTLTDLAGELDVAKSTASERLHRAEEKVIKRFVRDSEPDVLAAHRSTQ
jgi:hypothetical protein